MIGLRTKKEAKCPLVSSEDLRELLNNQIKLSVLNETNRVKLNETLRLLELLRTVIVVRLASLER